VAINRSERGILRLTLEGPTSRSNALYDLLAQPYNRPQLLDEPLPLSNVATHVSMAVEVLVESYVPGRTSIEIVKGRIRRAVESYGVRPEEVGGYHKPHNSGSHAQRL
jgi:hypothetical protein